MGYAHINNLYKDQRILDEDECWAMEKIHGTSAHIAFKIGEPMRFFSGGEKHDKFVALFDEEKLQLAFDKLVLDGDTEEDNDGLVSATLYGEAYGGKQQGMSYLYGPELKFIVFDVKVNGEWIDVPFAESWADYFGLDFVWYTRTTTEVEKLDALRDMDCIQAVRNGVDLENLPKGCKPIGEGVVLRPITEKRDHRGNRICAKHKSAEFSERRKQPKVADPEKLKILSEAKEIATEWVTPMRLAHVLDKMPHDTSIENMRDVIHAMFEDVTREAEGEIVVNKAVQ